MIKLVSPWLSKNAGLHELPRAEKYDFIKNRKFMHKLGSRVKQAQKKLQCSA